MFFLIAAPEQNTVALIYATNAPQFDSETVAVFRLTKSNKPLWNQFEPILTRYNSYLKHGTGVTLEADGTHTFFKHQFI